MKKLILLVILAASLVISGCANEFVKIGNPTPNPLPDAPDGIDTPTDPGDNDPVTLEGAGKAFWSKNPKWAGDTAEGAVYATEIDAEGGSIVVASTLFDGTITATIHFNEDGAFSSDSFADGLKLVGSVTDSAVKVIAAGEKAIAVLAKAEFDDILIFISSKMGSEQAEETKAAKSEWDDLEKDNKKKIYDVGDLF